MRQTTRLLMIYIISIPDRFVSAARNLAILEQPRINSPHCLKLPHLDVEPHSNGSEDCTSSNTSSLHRRCSALEGGDGRVGSATSWLSNA